MRIFATISEVLFLKQKPYLLFHRTPFHKLVLPHQAVKPLQEKKSKQTKQPTHNPAKNSS